MEFWGVEVKPGQSHNVTPEDNKLIHISQVALGEVKKGKGADYVPVRLKIDDAKFVLGTLSAESRPQLTFDLVFEKEFELSHDWKNGSVYFCGYTADNPDAANEFDSDDYSSASDMEQDFPLNTTDNGKLELNVDVVKPAKAKMTSLKAESSTKSKVPLVEPNKDKDSEISDDSKELADESSEDSYVSDESDDDESDDKDEDEETPKKAEPAKKRPSESAIKTPVPAKKGKLETPQKTDGKKGGGHTATPHPSKQAGKTPAAANTNKSKGQTPKSSSQISCKSCSKTFSSEKAVESHSKAKHTGK